MGDSHHLITELQQRQRELAMQREQIDADLALIPRLIQILTDQQLRAAALTIGSACSLPYASATGAPLDA